MEITQQQKDEIYNALTDEYQVVGEIATKTKINYYVVKEALMQLQAENKAEQIVIITKKRQTQRYKRIPLQGAEIIV